MINACGKNHLKLIPSVCACWSTTFPNTKKGHACIVRLAFCLLPDKISICGAIIIPTYMLNAHVKFIYTFVSSFYQNEQAMYVRN